MEDHVHRGYKYSRGIERNCPECKRLSVAIHKRSEMRSAREKQQVVVDDFEQVRLFRRRVETLIRRGASKKRIAKEIGLSEQHLGRILSKSYKRGIWQSTIDNLERFYPEWLKALPPDSYSDTRTDVTLSKHAIEGLMLRGWTAGWIGKQVGASQQQITLILTGQQKRVTTRREQQFVDLAKKYGTTDGPSTRTRNLAVRRGYQSTAMFDELL